jgi:hypothetical protein
MTYAHEDCTTLSPVTLCALAHSSAIAKRRCVAAVDFESHPTGCTVSGRLCSVASQPRRVDRRIFWGRPPDPRGPGARHRVVRVQYEPRRRCSGLVRRVAVVHAWSLTGLGSWPAGDGRIGVSDWQCAKRSRGPTSIPALSRSAVRGGSQSVGGRRYFLRYLGRRVGHLPLSADGAMRTVLISEGTTFAMFFRSSE